MSQQEREEFVSWLSGTYPYAWSRHQAENAWDQGHISRLAWVAGRAAIAQQANQATAVGAEPDWQAMLYAPRDGSKIELLVEHREYWIALKAGRADGYRQACEGHWVDFNGGGWSWMGTAGQPIGWRPLRAGPAFDVPVQHKERA